MATQHQAKNTNPQHTQALQQLGVNTELQHKAARMGLDWGKLINTFGPVILQFLEDMIQNQSPSTQSTQQQAP